jgi:hypothetical protein
VTYTSTWYPPTPNLLPQFVTFGELRTACNQFLSCSMRDRTAPPGTHRLSGWPKSENACTRCPPDHSLAVFGVTRSVPLIHFDGGEHSLADDYAGQEVRVGQQDDEIVIVDVGGSGCARDHALGTDRTWSTSS